MLEARPEPGLYSANLERDEAMSRLVDETRTPATEDPGATAAPAGAQSDPDAVPSLRERGQLRRRVRYLRKLRELQLRDLGGFLLEQARTGRENQDVLRTKLGGASETDRELRALERALGGRRPLREVREAGIGGACPACGTVHGSTDRYCSWCGQSL
jgi:hypothetical protein